MSVAITAEDFDFEIDVEGIDLEAVEEAAEKPAFPIIIFWIALIKDGFDGLSVGFMAYLTNWMIVLVIWLWMLGKSSLMRKLMRKVVLKRVKNWAIKKHVPVLNAIPFTTTLVAMIYYEETKIVKFLDELIEEAYYNKNIAIEEVIRARFEDVF